jgi:hypothetical protein
MINVVIPPSLAMIFLFSSTRQLSALDQRARACSEMKRVCVKRTVQRKISQRANGFALNAIVCGLEQFE